MSEQSEQRYARLSELTQSAAVRLQLPADHPKVTGLAALLLKHELLQAQLVNGGKDVDPNVLVNLSEAIERACPTLPPPLKVELKIAPKAAITCPCGCGHTFSPYNMKPVTPPEAPPTAPARPKPDGASAPAQISFHGLGRPLLSTGRRIAPKQH